MPVYQAEIQKSYGDEEWVNVYHVSAVDIANAVAMMADIIDAERQVHLDVITFDRLLVRDMDPEVDQFSIIPLSGQGIRSTTSFQPLPLFNCLRVDLGYGLGRLGRKYLRGCLHEGDQNIGVLESGTVSGYQTDYADAIVALEVLTKADATLLTSATVHNRVAMRQLKRKKRSVVTP